MFWVHIICFFKVIGVIDKSIGHALRVMRHHPERFDGAVTDDMKRFISSGGHVGEL